jgi:ubiquinone/menaquinone biosynthesis C-methylase UbiE
VVDNLKAFTGLAGGYHAHRPRYPDDLVALIGTHVMARVQDGSWSQSPLILDAGSGTGILTLQLAERLPDDMRFSGVEPNDDMREAASTSSSRRNVAFVEGVAERLPVDDAAASMVTAAQALQWFNRPAFYGECRRVLRGAGLVAILQNDRDWRNDPFLEAYEALLEDLSPGYSRFYRSFDIEQDMTDNGFKPLLAARATWSRSMSREEFRGMSLSSTKMQSAVRQHGEDRVLARLDELMSAHFGANGTVTIAYQSELRMAEPHSDRH